MQTRVGMHLLPQLGAAGALRPGGEIAGYRLTDELGRGGMGVVFRAEHVHLRRTVALKVLAPHLSEEPSFRERFVRESRTAAALHHPNVVPVLDAGEARGMLYLAMQLVEGADLGERLRDGPLEPALALRLLRQIAAALDAAHAAGLVHRDVKPGNVLLDRGDHAYLSDFGLTKRATSHTALTAAGQVVGSADYLAPEQIDGRGIDARTDVYSLGCVLYHCLTGAPPFAGESDVQVLFAHAHKPPPPLSAARPDLPAALGETLRRSLAKDPLARQPSCGALIEAAEHALAEPGDRGTRTGRGMPRVLVAAPVSGALVRASLAPAEFELEDLPGEGALVDAVRAAPPDVVVFEPGAPAADAREACRALRRAAGEGSWLLAIVPRGSEATADGLAEAGADDHLVAPFSAMQLVVKVRHAVTARR